MKSRTFYYEHDLIVPDHCADWDVWEYWERPRTDSIVEHMPHGGTLIDVGVEHGSLSALYQYLRPDMRMALIEPSCEFWPNIRLTWQANMLPGPVACCVALVGEENHGDPETAIWPECAASDIECEPKSYRYLHQHTDTPQVTLDAWATFPVHGITIDVEGAELRVLRGAHDLLVSARPAVWVSVHPDLMERDYGHVPADLQSFMFDVGYRGAHLATDHEEHWCYMPKERA